MLDSKKYKVVRISNMWSTEKLRKEVENKLNEAMDKGWEVVSVAYGFSVWYIPTAFITLLVDDFEF